MVFYRKYRPQNIKDLDSKEIRDKLSSILKSDSIPHAFLFTGSKGLGKTSTARIVAKVVNCERLLTRNKKQKTDDIEPCNICAQCISITKGTNLDVLEIDGASNRGIDEIRDLREKIRLAPVSSAKKVYIIDEVHMLTTEAFNALLKTLEEPPPHALFILCTTEAHKVPSTIVSRCFQLIFTKATEEELVHSLKRLVKAEKIDISEEGIHIIAQRSDGGFREAAKILEEVVAISDGKKITEEILEEKYHTVYISDYIEKTIQALSVKDTKKSLEIIAVLMKEGIDIKFFLEQLIENLHTLLLSKVGIQNIQFKNQDIKLSIEDIKTLVELFSKAYGELKYAVLPQLPLEIAIIEWSLIDIAGRPSHVARDAQKSEQLNNITIPSLSEGGHQESEKTSKSSAPAFSSRASGQPSSSPTNNSLLSQLIQAIKPQNYSIAGVLRGCRVKEQGEKKFILETSYKFHKDKLTEQKTVKLIEDALKEITQKKVEFSVSLTI